MFAYIISYNIINHSKGKGLINGISFALLIIIAIIFIFFTLSPAHIPFFLDLKTQTYGITKQH